MEWKAWSPLGDSERPPEIRESSSAGTSLLMSLSIEAYGTTSQDLAIQWGHYLFEGVPTSTAIRRQIIEAVIEALHTESDRLVDEQNSPDELA